VVAQVGAVGVPGGRLDLGDGEVRLDELHHRRVGFDVAGRLDLVDQPMLGLLGQL
jgi:hypothetical protein